MKAEQNSSKVTWRDLAKIDTNKSKATTVQQGDDQNKVTSYFI